MTKNIINITITNMVNMTENYVNVFILTIHVSKKMLLIEYWIHKDLRVFSSFFLLMVLSLKKGLSFNLES